MIAEIAVDLDAIARNAAALARLVAPAKLSAVVKANAYGHGLVPVARALAPHAARLCVYALEEAVELREAGIAAPLHVLGPIPPGELELAHAADVAVTLWDRGLYARQVASVARRRRRRDGRASQDRDRRRAARLGAGGRPGRAGALRRDARVRAGRGVHAPGRRPRSWTRRSPGSSSLASRPLPGALPVTVERHVAATAAAMLWPDTRLDAVRCGIGLYGIWPSADSEALLQRRGLGARTGTELAEPGRRAPRVETGTTVGYGRTWTAARPSLIGTLPIGYAEGLPRSAGNSARALVRGRRVPLVGRICMDMSFLDLTDVAGAAVGDAVTLIGRDGGERITAEQLGAACGTIGYEIVARLPAHVPRTYGGVAAEGAMSAGGIR